MTAITPLGDGERSADYYSCRDVDHLQHDTVNDAVENELDSTGPESWPDELLVMGYVEDDSEDHEVLEDYLMPVVRDEDCDVMVNVAAWIREHMAHWLEEPEVAAWVAERGPELPPDFFSDPILTHPGEDLIASVRSARGT